MNHIAPLGICLYPVNVFLRRPGIAHQQYMLHIISLAPGYDKDFPKAEAESRGQRDIQHHKQKYHGSGEMLLPDHKQDGRQAYRSDDIRLHDPEQFAAGTRPPLCRIQLTGFVNDQIRCYNIRNGGKISLHGQIKIARFYIA